MALQASNGVFRQNAEVNSLKNEYSRISVNRHQLRGRNRPPLLQAMNALRFNTAEQVSTFVSQTLLANNSQHC